MNKEAFDFNLPDELIAQYPLPERSDSRLLVYRRSHDESAHHYFKELSNFLEPGDLLVMNNSRVIPARLYGHKASGGKVELLVERILNSQEFFAHIKASKTLRPHSLIHLTDIWSLEVIEKIDDLYHCRLLTGELEAMLAAIGHIPLPPYIGRGDEEFDLKRYQTVYAEHNGSVAAPTAGLHFDENLLAQLKHNHIQIGYVTLHVGAGTFRPVRCANILEHKMHAEQFFVSSELCAMVNKTRAAGNRVIAVGTTSLRSLESAGQSGELKPKQGETDIFIYPGYQFKICDGLITNFHLPQSTLLMLVAAFIGHTQAMSLYQMAIAERYRFYSYGDACLFL